MAWLLVVVDDFDVDGFAVFPDEADAKLIVDPDGILTGAATAKCL
jgi:hypothetical protein